VNPRSALALGCFFSAILCLEGISWLLNHAEPSPDRLLWIGLFSQGVWVCAAIGGAAVARSAPLRDRLGLAPSTLSPGSFIVLLLGFVIFSHGLHQLLGVLQLRDAGALARIDGAVAAAAQGPSLLLAVVAFGLAPGLGEELLFRGLIQRALARRFAAGIAIGVASGLFALAHGDRIHSSAAFPLGLYLGLVAHLGRSVKPAIACHVANNCLGLVALASGASLWVSGGLGSALASLGLGVALVIGVSWRQGCTAGQ